jgi:hypothetical protein
MLKDIMATKFSNLVKIKLTYIAKILTDSKYSKGDPS